MPKLLIITVYTKDSSRYFASTDVRGGKALSVLFKDLLNKELLLSNREPLTVLVSGTSIYYAIKTRA